MSWIENYNSPQTTHGMGYQGTSNNYFNAQGIGPNSSAGYIPISSYGNGHKRIIRQPIPAVASSDIAVYPHTPYGGYTTLQNAYCPYQCKNGIIPACGMRKK